MKLGTVAFVALLALPVAFSAGCTRQPGVQAAERSSVLGPQQLPFEQASDKEGISPTGALSPADIPAGALLTVSMQTPISSATARPGDVFDAVLDEPIVIRGREIAARGAAVTGQVLTAKAAEAPYPGYVRLKLTTIVIDGKSLPLQTSSVFLKAASSQKRNVNLAGSGGNPGEQISYRNGQKNDVVFSADRRVTFRLTQSVSM